jgi:hypothetical protein
MIIAKILVFWDIGTYIVRTLAAGGKEDCAAQAMKRGPRGLRLTRWWRMGRGVLVDDHADAVLPEFNRADTDGGGDDEHDYRSEN